MPGTQEVAPVATGHRGERQRASECGPFREVMKTNKQVPKAVAPSRNRRNGL